MFYSQIKDKKVFAISGAGYCGQVKGVFIEREAFTVRYILLSDAERSILPFNDIYAFGETLMIRSKDCLAPLSKAEGLLFFDTDLPLYDVDGNLLGLTEDLNLHSKYNDRTFTAGGAKYRLKSAVASSADAVIINPKNKAVFPRQRQEAEVTPEPVQSEKETANASPLPVQKPYEEIEPALETPIIYKEAPAPEENGERAKNDYGFLIGRRVERDITDITRTFVIKAGTIINDRVIESAKRAGKLVDLTINSKKAN